MSQALLETGHQRLLVPGLDIDDAVWIKPGLAKRRGEQVRSGNAPQHLSGQAGDDARREQRRCSAAHSVVSAAGHFVQCPQCQPSARKDGVQRSHLERKDADRFAIGPLQGAHLGAQVFKIGRADGLHGRDPP